MQVAAASPAPSLRPVPWARLGWHQSQPLNLCSQLGFQCGQARVVFTERLKLEGNINLHIFLRR